MEKVNYSSVKLHISCCSPLSSSALQVIFDSDVGFLVGEPSAVPENLDPDGVFGCGGWCRSGEFLCMGSCTCVPVAWRCDGDADCVSGEDEILCSVPTLQQICPQDTHIRLEAATTLSTVILFVLFVQTSTSRAALLVIKYSF